MLLTKEERDEAIRKYGKRDYLTRLCEEANERRNEIRARKGLPPISQSPIQELIAEERRKEQLEKMRERNAELQRRLRRYYEWCESNDIRPALNHYLWVHMTEMERRAYIRGWREMARDDAIKERHRKEREERRSRWRMD